MLKPFFSPGITGGLLPLKHQKDRAAFLKPLILFWSKDMNNITIEDKALAFTPAAANHSLYGNPECNLQRPYHPESDRESDTNSQ